MQVKNSQYNWLIVNLPGTGLGHADHETLPESAGLAGGPVLLVHDTPVAVLALLYHRLVVTGSTEEGLASLAGEGAEVEAGCWFLAHPAQLVLQRVNLVNLKQQELNL